MQPPLLIHLILLPTPQQKVSTMLYFPFEYVWMYIHLDQNVHISKDYVSDWIRLKLSNPPPRLLLHF